MSYDIKRVPLDFDWPLNELWQGYVRPARLTLPECPDCGGTGLSRQAHAIYEAFYPEWRSGVRGGGWYNQLTQDEVEYLQSQDCLEVYDHGQRQWVRVPNLTAQEVNAAQTPANVFHPYYLGEIPRWLLSKRRAEQAGHRPVCLRCDENGTIEAYPGQRAAADTWQRTHPPEGPGWQLWETTSEGSPQSPVFSTAETLVDWMVQNKGLRHSAAQQIVADGGTVADVMVATVAGRQVALDGDRDADIIAGVREERRRNPR